MTINIVPSGWLTMLESMEKYELTKSQIVYGARQGVVQFVTLGNGMRLYDPTSLRRLAATRRRSIRPSELVAR